MRTGHDATLRLLPKALMAAFFVCAMAVAPASANTPKVPHYSLSIVTGESTRPEDTIAGVSASASGNAMVRVRIIHAGAVVYEHQGEGYTGLPELPEVGDEVTVESPLSTIVGSIAYDGLPSIDPTVCAGSASFSGQRSGADTVSGGYYTLLAETDPYGHIYEYRRSSAGQAQVTLLSGSTFGGSFLAPLSLGETVFASESVEVPLTGGAIFTYESEAVRPVGSCPAPPAPPPAPPAPIIPSLRASIAKVLGATIKLILKHGFKDSVELNQAGTVTQGLYLENGTLPASVSSVSYKHHPATLLAKGSASSHAAGKVTVDLRLTKAGRSRLRSLSKAHAVLVTTVRNASGSKLNLSHRVVTLHR